MIPGSISKIKEEVVPSAATIFVKADLVRISGATQIDNILCSLQGSPLVVFLVATDGAVVVSTAGNVLVGQTLAQNRVYGFFWSKTLGKWYIQGVV